MGHLIPIVIVEDEENIRNILAYNLQQDGFVVHLAEDGHSGLELIHKTKPELVLLDWMMPGMNGLEVLQELKNNDDTKDSANAFIHCIYPGRGSMMNSAEMSY